MAGVWDSLLVVVAPLINGRDLVNVFPPICQPRGIVQPFVIDNRLIVGDYLMLLCCLVVVGCLVVAGSLFVVVGQLDGGDWGWTVCASAGWGEGAAPKAYDLYGGLASIRWSMLFRYAKSQYGLCRGTVSQVPV